MDEPHVHVEWAVPNTSAAMRAVTASVLGFVGDAPRTVRTGCDLEVPYASTSVHPERVTCLPCREHARDRHRGYATTIEESAALLGADRTRAAFAAARRMREIADRFG
jgi:hypothetical protein